MKHTLALLAVAALPVNAATYVLYDGSLADKNPVNQGWVGTGLNGQNNYADANGWTVDDTFDDNTLPRFRKYLTAGQLADLVANGGTLTMTIESIAGGGFTNAGTLNNEGDGLFGAVAGDHYRSGIGVGGIGNGNTGVLTWTFDAVNDTIDPGWGGSNSSYGGDLEDQLLVQFESGSSNTDTAKFVVQNVTLTTIPEPSSVALLGLGGLALILRRRK